MAKTTDTTNIMEDEFRKYFELKSKLENKKPIEAAVTTTKHVTERIKFSKGDQQYNKMKLDQHFDILLHCVIYAKTQSYDAAIGVSRIHELEESLNSSLPTQYKVLIQHYGTLINYFLQVQKRGSTIYDKFYKHALEGFQVMSEIDYYNDSRGFEPLCYNFTDSYNSFVFVVLPYNKNHVLQEIKKDVKKAAKQQVKVVDEAKKMMLKQPMPPRKGKTKKHDPSEQDEALEKEILDLYRVSVREKNLGDLIYFNVFYYMIGLRCQGRRT
jgi:hypothetical protein